MTVAQIIVLLQWLVSLGLPILVALVTATQASSAVKALVNLGLSALSTALITIVAALTSGTTIDWFTIIFTFVTGFIVSAGSYTHLWKPTGVAPAAAERGVKGKHSLAA